jgi:hypothetical protein
MPLLITALDRGEWSASHPGRFTPGKDRRVSIGQKVGWTPEPVWTLWYMEKFLAPAGNRNLVVQPVAHRDTGWDKGVWIMKWRGYGLKQLEPNCDIISVYARRRSRDSAVGIATGYGLDDRGVGVRVPVGSRIFSSPRRPDRLWGPPNLLSNGYRGSFTRGKAAGAWSWPLSSS